MERQRLRCRILAGEVARAPVGGCPRASNRAILRLQFIRFGSDTPELVGDRERSRTGPGLDCCRSGFTPRWHFESRDKPAPTVEEMLGCMGCLDQMLRSLLRGSLLKTPWIFRALLPSSLCPHWSYCERFKRFDRSYATSQIKDLCLPPEKPPCAMWRPRRTCRWRPFRWH
jgi:hypothetical protein